MNQTQKPSERIIYIYNEKGGQWWINGKPIDEFIYSQSIVQYLDEQQEKSK